ncbi:MAG: hypothetical protein ACK4K1_01590 [Flavobacterium sp.]
MSKKIIRVEGEASDETPRATTKQFVATAEAVGKAKQLRMFAIFAWLIAMAGQVYAILKLIHDDKLTWLIVAIVVMLALAVTGNLLWKKANRLDSASEKDGFKFFVQNQLGAILSALAFLPLLIFILTNKNISGKTKGIAGVVAGIALLVGVGTGIDFNPPSVEQYTEQTREVEMLNDGNNFVYWTKSGSKYHLYSDCSYINTDRTVEINEGSVAQARELKNITELCSRCRGKAMKAKNLSEDDVINEVKQVMDSISP